MWLTSAFEHIIKLGEAMEKVIISSLGNKLHTKAIRHIESKLSSLVQSAIWQLRVEILLDMNASKLINCST